MTFEEIVKMTDNPISDHQAAEFIINQVLSHPGIFSASLSFFHIKFLILSITFIVEFLIDFIVIIIRRGGYFVFGSNDQFSSGHF